MTGVAEAAASRYRAWMLTHGCALSTAEKGLRYLRWFEREKQLDLDPEKLDEQSVMEFLALWRQAGVKPRTLNSWIRELNLWSRFNALEWKMPYFRRHDQPILKVPDRALVRKLLSLRWDTPGTEARNRAILGLLANTGIRRGELVHLLLGDRVQLANGPGLLIRFGKGEKSRVVPIDPEVSTAISNYVDTHRSRSHPTAMFTTAQGAVSYAYLGRIVKEAGVRVGAPWLSAHKVRHYVVDTCLDAGMPVSSVAEMMGHVRWETTQLYRQKRLAGIRTEADFRATSELRSVFKVLPKDKEKKLKRIEAEIDRKGASGDESCAESSGSTGNRPSSPKSTDALLPAVAWDLITSYIGEATGR